MAEIKKTRTRMYDPWGYQEENNYESSENQFEIELNELFASATYDDSDKKIHFFNNDGKELSGSSIDTTQFAGGSIIKRAYYDPETKILTIEFENGDKVEVDFGELVDETEFGDGLQVVDSIVSILIDGSGEPYLSVGENGLKIVGINQAIADAVNAEKARAEQAEADLQTAIEAEEARAISAETALDAKIDQEIADRIADVDAEETRAKAAEDALDAKIDQEIQDRKDDVDAEEARATAAETVLSQQITNLNSELDAEESIREAADVALGLRIDNEIADRKADVDAEETRAKAAEEALDTKIDAEEARATSAETILQAAIEAEGQRAQDAEATLDEKIDGVISGDTPIVKLENLIEKLGYQDNDTLNTTGEHEVAFGEWNISHYDDVNPSGQTVFSVGIGTSDENRKNAIEIMKDGSVFMWIEGEFMNINKILGQISHEVY